MYSRACLSRTVVIVVALLLPAASANAVAREFRTAGTQDENPTVEALRHMGRLIAERGGGRNQIRMFDSRQWKALEQRSRSQAEGAGVTIATDFDRNPFESAMAGSYDKAERDAADAKLISRIRKVE